MMKKSKRKDFIKFIIFCAACGAMGYAGGYYAGRNNTWLTGFLDLVIGAVPGYADIIMYLLSLLLAAGLYCGLKAKKMSALYDSDDDDAYEKVDSIREKALVYSNMLFIAGIVDMAIISDGLRRGESYKALTVTALYLVYLIGSVAVQNMAVEATKKINPEKKGNVFSFNFKKDWMDSCDEAEKAKIGQAAYKSYTATQICLIFFEVGFMVLSLVYPFSWVPAAVIGVIMSVQLLTYVKASK